jgi:hypothetical protein
MIQKISPALSLSSGATRRQKVAKDKRSFKIFEKYGDAKKFENKLQSELAEGTYAAPSDHTLKQ